MSRENTPNENENQRPVRDLKTAVNNARDRLADRADVVVDLKASETGRLELLANELQPVFDGVDETDDRFEFALSKGERPRLWIDMTSFVAMGADKRSYRFIKDTRTGRIVLAETGDMEKAADIVSDYVAEKVLERERMIEGEWVSFRAQKGEPAEQDTGPQVAETTAEVAEPVMAEKIVRKGGFLRSLFWFLFGALAVVAAFIATALLLVPDAL
ncbi:MAG: hypothetical protein AAF903_13405 [Pseudomonadota bacterium]